MIEQLSTRYLRNAALFCTLLAAGVATAAPTAVRVTGAWVRATVPGQPVAGAYLELESPVAVRLVGIASPAAGRGEVHEMKEQDGMMTMRPLDGLDLPAGKRVTLAPGGLHIMLFDLRQPLRAGTEVVLTLTFESRPGSRFKQNVTAPVRAMDGAAGKH